MVRVRKETKAQLRQSEERYRSLFKHMLDGFAYCRILCEEGEPKDFVYLTVNDAFEQLTGLRNVVGKKVSEVIPGVHQSNPELLEIYGRVALSGRPERFETYLKPLDIWFSVAVYSPQKEHFVAVFDNVTERKRQREALQKERDRLSALVNSMTDELWFADSEGNVTLMNPAVRQELGPALGNARTVQEIAANLEVYRPDGTPRPLEEAPLLRALRGETVKEQEELMRTSARGELRLRQANAAPVRNPDGSILGAVCLVRDVTERKRAEEKLRQSRDRLQRVLDTEAVGVMFWDLSTGRMIDANETFLKTMGYSRREVEAGELTWQRLTPAEYVEVSRAEIRKFMATGRVGPYEKEYFRKDGTKLWLLFAGSALGQNECVEFCVDISARKAAEAALRQSEERFELAVRSAGTGIWDYNIDSGHVYFSPRWKSLFGYEDQEIGESVEDWARLLHPEEKERVLKLQEDFLAGTASTLNAEYRLRHKDGSYRWIHAQGLVVRDEHGKARRFVGSHGDVTERKLAEDALREANQRLAYHVQNTPLAVIEFDAELRVRAWSDGAQRIFGWEAAEVVGQRMWEIPWICEEERGKLQEVSAGLKDGATPRSVSPNRNVRKDGKVIWCEWYNSSLTDGAGKMQSIQSLVLDVTERKKAEERLRESEERFRTMADSTPVMIWTTDTRGKARFINRTYCEFFGVTQEQVSTQGWQPLIHPDDVGSYAARFQEAIDKQQVFRAQTRVRRHDGAWRWIESYSQPLITPAGEFFGMAGCSPDITEQKEFEAELQRVVSERTGRLQEMVAELEHVSYTITHDMRAPLRAMRAFAEMLKEEGERLGDEGKGFVARIITGAERMDGLITDALNYTKTVRTELPVGPVAVGRLLRGMLDTYPQFQAAEAEIVLERNLPVVIGNEAGLTQCFSNLLDNAVKFGKPSERTRIRVRAEEVQSEGCTAKSGRVRIWVEDEGIGISKEMLPRVFDMFSRGSSPQAGTGIGLALVRKVVERMGGKVGVESELGKGSRFWVELKAADGGHAVGGEGPEQQA